jgi:hypothetical protein
MGGYEAAFSAVARVYDIAADAYRNLAPFR